MVGSPPGITLPPAPCCWTLPSATHCALHGAPSGFLPASTFRFLPPACPRNSGCTSARCRPHGPCSFLVATARGGLLPCVRNKRLAPGHGPDWHPQAWEPDLGPAVPTAFCPVPSCFGADLSFLGWEGGDQILCRGPVAPRSLLAAGGAGPRLTGGLWAYCLNPGGSALASCASCGGCQLPALSGPLPLHFPAHP